MQISNIYTVEQLKKAISDNDFEKVQDYLGRMPENIRTILFNSIKNEELESTYKLYKMDMDYNIKLADARLIENPYKNEEFGKRIDTDILILYEVNENKCPIHNMELCDQQIVFTYQEYKKYGFKIPACVECKKLYISEAEFNKIYPILYEKKFVYCFHRMNGDNTSIPEIYNEEKSEVSKDE